VNYSNLFFIYTQKITKRKKYEFLTASLKRKLRKSYFNIIGNSVKKSVSAQETHYSNSTNKKTKINRIARRAKEDEKP